MVFETERMMAENILKQVTEPEKVLSSGDKEWARKVANAMTWLKKTSFFAIEIWLAVLFAGYFNTFIDSGIAGYAVWGTAIIYMFFKAKDYFFKKTEYIKKPEIMEVINNGKKETSVGEEIPNNDSTNKER